MTPRRWPYTGIYLPLALFAAATLLIAGCGGQTGQGQGSPVETSDVDQPGFGGKCSGEVPSPLTPNDLMAVAERDGITLLQPSGCPAPSHASAVANSIGAEDPRSSEERRRVVTEQGYILCSLFAVPRFGTHVETLHYEAEEEIHMRVSNVTCAIYPTPGHEGEQSDRLKAVMDALAQVAAQR